MVIFGILSLSAGLMILRLPETLNSNMSQTIEEANLAKEYYGFMWMGKRVGNPFPCLRWDIARNTLKQVKLYWRVEDSILQLTYEFKYQSPLFLSSYVYGSAVVKQDDRDILTYWFSILYLFFCRVSLCYCHFCVNMSANHITVEELRATFDEKYFVTSILLFRPSYSNTW